MTGGETSGDANIVPNQTLNRPVTTVTSVTTCFEGGAASSVTDRPPAEWHAVLAGLERCNPVDWLAPDRWSAMVLDAENFLTRWGNVAEHLGWTALDLFGVHPFAPGARIGCWGLLLLIQGGEVVALTADTAMIRRQSGAALTYRRCDQAGVVLLTQVAR